MIKSRGVVAKIGQKIYLPPSGGRTFFSDFFSHLAFDTYVFSKNASPPFKRLMMNTSMPIYSPEFSPADPKVCPTLA